MNRLSVICLNLCLGLLCILPASAAEEHLTLLFTNDTHNRLRPFYNVKLQKQVGGIARRARYFAQVRKENPKTLILDAGDVFQGTPFYNFYLGEPDIKAMGAAGYDVMTVGNHDLDNGILNLKKQTQYADFPLLNGNVTYSKNGLLAFRPFHIFDIYGTKIGVMGFLSPHAWQAVATKNKEGLTFLDPVKQANKISEQIRPKVDLLISLHHAGIFHDVDYAKEMKGVDIIVGGHSHTQMDKAQFVKNNNPNGIGGTLIHQAYYMGVYVGRIDLYLEDGKIKRYTSKLVLMDDSFDKAPAQPEKVSEIVESYGKKLDKDMNQVLGESLENMSTDGKYKGPFGLGSLMADIIRESHKTEIGIMNTGGVRSDLPKGPITVGNIFQIMPFDNAITTFKMQGKDLRKILEINASRLGISKNMQFSGIAYTVKGKNLVSASVNGKPLEPNRWYTVAAPDYVFQGNEAMSFEAAKDAYSTGVLIRDLMIDYVKRVKQVKAPKDQRLIRK